MALNNLERENIFRDLEESFTEIFEILENNDIDVNCDDEVLSQIADDLERIYDVIKENT